MESHDSIEKWSRHLPPKSRPGGQTVGSVEPLSDSRGLKGLACPIGRLVLALIRPPERHPIPAGREASHEAPVGPQARADGPAVGKATVEPSAAFCPLPGES
jgi:hypothetical protein